MESLRSPLVLVLVMAATAATAVAHSPAKLPFYIKPCSRNEPNLNECALKAALAAVPYLIPGDPSVKLPPLDPLRIEEIRVEQQGSVGLNLLLRDVDMMGLAHADLRDVRIDLEKHTLTIELFVPSIQLIGQYNISGRILILPIHGKGDSNITLENVPLKYTTRYELVTYKGKDYIRIMDKSVDFDTSQAHFNFENLFDGDERLRENVRRVVNENWRQVIEDIGPHVASAVGEVVTQLLRNFLTGLPYDVILPDVPPREQ